MNNKIIIIYLYCCMYYLLMRWEEGNINNIMETLNSRDLATERSYCILGKGRQSTNPDTSPHQFSC